MSYAASAASGAKIQVNINSALTTIPGVEGIPAFGAEKSQIETTPIDATAKTFIGDVPDYGEVTLNLMWDPADTVHQYLATSAATPAKSEGFKVIYGSNNATFAGEVMSFKPSFNKGSAKVAECKIKLSSAVTFA